MPKRLVSRTGVGFRLDLRTLPDCGGPRTGRSMAGADRLVHREERLGDDAIEASGVPFDGVVKSTNCFECTGTAVAVGTTPVGACG
jgi:hypothetical protein